MAWPLSHTSEAYQYAADRIRELSHPELVEAAIAWKKELRKRGEIVSDFNATKLSKAILADFVIEHALSEEYGSCSNGGWELYVDPDGWITVPFGPVEEDDGDA